MVINNSPYISFLSVNATFDISGVNPVVLLENFSQGQNLSGVSYAFIVKSPSTTYILNGDINSPQITGVWYTYTISNPWPRPFNQIEWSGAPYTFQVIAKDNDGNIFTGPVQEASICRPNGNLPNSKNTFGIGAVTVQTKCEQARIFFQDVTNVSYRGFDGQRLSSVLRVNYPMDNTGVVPQPFVGANFSTALVPITYSGKGYQFLYTSIYEYQLTENTAVKIKYLKSDAFGVWCNIDLMPLMCEYQKMIDGIESGSCADVEATNQKLMLINPKFSMVVMGMFQPLTGIDVPALIEEIKAIGGFVCDCCEAATGIVPTGSSAFDGYNFSIVPVGGDISGQVVPNGYNIQFELSDVSYIFKICDGSPSQTTAFEILPSVSDDGYTKTYCLSVDIAQLSEDIFNTTATNAGLVNLINSLIVNGGGSSSLVVDGGCIFDTAASCDYTFTLTGIPANTTFAIFSSIKTGTVTNPVNFSFNLTNLAALQTYLNGLGIGTFVVSNPSGNNVLISSNANTFGVNTLTYKNPTTLIASMTQNCTGFQPLSANEVVQNIINYLCTINDTQIVTSQAYQICYIDPVTQIPTISTVATENSLSTFIQELLARGCDTINYIVSLGSVNCDTIKAQFPVRSQVMNSNDVFLVTKGGLCSSAYPAEALLYMLTYGAYNSEVVTAFCNFMQVCGGGFPCLPYEYFFVEVDSSSPSSVIDLIVNFSHSDAVSNTIRYARIDNTLTPSYITIPGILPGQDPYTISGVANGQYRVYIKPIYADGRACSEIFVDTPACSGINSFSASYNGTNIVVTYSAEGSLPQVRVNVTYPNGGAFSQVYNNGDSISITPPSGVFGTYFATIQPVCNSTSGFFGQQSAPASFDITTTQTVLLEVIDPRPSSTNQMVNVTGISGFTFGSTINESGVQTGTHGAFTGAISVQIRQPAIPSGIVNNGLLLTINGTPTECINIVSASLFPQTLTFSSRTYAENDVIRITYDYSACSTSPSMFGLYNVENNGAVDVIISSVTPAPTIVTGVFPITHGQEVDGTHVGFSSSISVDVQVVGSTPDLRLYKNMALQETLPVSVTGTYVFGSLSYSPSDNILITIG